MGHSVHNLLTPSVHNLMTLTVHEVLTLYSPRSWYRCSTYPVLQGGTWPLFGGHLISSPVGLERKVIYHHVQVLRTVQTRCCGPL